jgi:hypothetical protein
MSLIKLIAIVFALLAGTAVTVDEYVDSYTVEAASSPMAPPIECSAPQQHCKQLSQDSLEEQEEEVVTVLHAA